MESGFFDTHQGGEPAYLQHVFWMLGYPETWLTIACWLLLLLGIIKAGRRLSRLTHRGWLALYCVAVVAAIGCFAILATQAMGAFAEGRGADTVIIAYVNRAVLLLGAASGGWIVVDWLKSRQST